MISPAYYATDTTFQIGDASFWDTNTAFEPMLAWCRAHNIDPAHVVNGHPLVRAEGEIRYVGGPLEDRRIVGPVTVPWDGWPAPWPAEVLRGMPEVADHYVVHSEVLDAGRVEGVFTHRDSAFLHARAVLAEHPSFSPDEVDVQHWRAATELDRWSVADLNTEGAAS